jgi:hypothetical protein
VRYDAKECPHETLVLEGHSLLVRVLDVYYLEVKLITNSLSIQKQVQIVVTFLYVQIAKNEKHEIGISGFLGPRFAKPIVFP